MNKAQERVFRILDFLLPQELLEQDIETLRRARILIGLLLTFVSLTLLSVSMFYEYPLTHQAWYSPYALGATSIASFVALYKTRAYKPPAIICSLGFCLVCVPVLFNLGGLYSRTTYWVCFVVLLVMFLLGRGWGIVCFLLVLGILLFLRLAPYVGLVPPAPLHPNSTQLLIAIAMFTTLAFSIGWLFESSRQRALDASLQALEEKQEMELAKNAAELSNTAKGEFLTRMSHELRTPLNAILGYSEILQEELEERGLEDLDEDLGRIQLSGKQLLSLIEDLLEISKVEAGDIKLEFSAFSLRELLDECHQEIVPMLSRNDNAFSLEVDDAIGVIVSDRGKLSQCLINLLDNACKFTDAGTITLAATVEDERLFLRVRDTGIGIPEERQERIFERFFQVDESNTRKFGGSGLGLALTRHFVTLMDGSLAVESVPGKGSTFTIRLPYLTESSD